MTTPVENGDLPGGEFDVFAARLFAGQPGLMVEFGADGWRVHGGWGFCT
jgi:hypothetical protein